MRIKNTNVKAKYKGNQNKTNNRKIAKFLKKLIEEEKLLTHC